MWTEIPFNPSQGYPVGKDLFYECSDCGERVPSLPQESIQCSCGNIFIDADAGRMAVKDESKIRLLRRRGK
jgi:ribosomal protein S27E